MAVSRPLLIVLVGVVLIGVVFALTRAGADGADTTALPGESLATAPAEPSVSPTAADGEPGAGGRSAQRRERGPRSTSAGRGSPVHVTNALADGKVVVVVLYQPGAGDDEAVLEALRDLDRASEDGTLRGNVEIFRDSVADAERYLGITAALGVTQAPAIAIIRPTGDARLLEGYQDEGSLRQHLEDAL